MTESLIPAGVEMRLGGRSDSLERDRGRPGFIKVAILSVVAVSRRQRFLAWYGPIVVY